MKKSVVAGLVLLALIVLISPGLVGYLAERSVEGQVEWAADENRQLDITTSGFERGWFSSAGRHRVAFASTPAGLALRDELGFTGPGSGPALIIDTTLDHGLVPLGSLRRESGSLAPGLGRAESRLSIEAPDGSVTALPGVITTRIGLGGAVTSHYAVDAGNAGNFDWGAADIRVTSDARQHRLEAEGWLEAFTFVSGSDSYASGRVDFSGDMVRSPFGFYVGDIAVTIDGLDRHVPGGSLSFGPLHLVSESTLAGSDIDNRFEIAAEVHDLPDVGDAAWYVEGRVDGLDAEALGRLLRRIKAERDDAPAGALFAATEPELRALVAAGLTLAIEQFRMTVPQGTSSAELTVSVPASGNTDFAWTSLLLAAEASGWLRVPVPLFELNAERNPDVRHLVAMGFLKRDGDDYLVETAYRKGLLTVNGAPMPVPLPQH